MCNAISDSEGEFTCTRRDPGPPVTRWTVQCGGTRTSTRPSTRVTGSGPDRGGLNPATRTIAVDRASAAAMTTALGRSRRRRPGSGPGRSSGGSAGVAAGVAAGVSAGVHSVRLTATTRSAKEFAAARTRPTRGHGQSGGCTTTTERQSRPRTDSITACHRSATATGDSSSSPTGSSIQSRAAAISAGDSGRPARPASTRTVSGPTSSTVDPASLAMASG